MAYMCNYGGTSSGALPDFQGLSLQRKAAAYDVHQWKVVPGKVAWWARSEGVVGKSYLPKSPLSAMPATGVLAGFGTDFMTNHAFGRGMVAVPVAWIDALAPHARAETVWQSSPFMLQRYGLALQLPAVRFIVGSFSFRQFEQRVIDAELECNAGPLSPQMTEAFDKISKQVCSLSEQFAHLQLSAAGMQQPLDSQMAAKHGMLTASSSTMPAQATRNSSNFGFMTIGPASLVRE
ncbi:TPA: hypothetical protein ACH3X1_016130 [Trebouxia sp. C0004]